MLGSLAWRNPLGCRHRQAPARRSPPPVAKAVRRDSAFPSSRAHAGRDLRTRRSNSRPPARAPRCVHQPRASPSACGYSTTRNHGRCRLGSFGLNPSFPRSSRLLVMAQPALIARRGGGSGPGRRDRRIVGALSSDRELVCVTHCGDQGVSREERSDARRREAAIRARVPARFELYRDPVSGKPLVNVRVARCRRLAVNGSAAPWTVAVLGVLIESPDGTGCTSRAPVVPIQTVVGNVPPFSWCNYFVIFIASDSRHFVEWLREDTPEFPAHYVPDFLWQDGEPVLATMPYRPFQFEAAAPTPSPFEIDAFFTRALGLGDIPVSASFWEPHEARRCEADPRVNASYGDLQGTLRTHPGTELAARRGPRRRTICPGTRSSVRSASTGSSVRRSFQSLPRLRRDDALDVSPRCRRDGDRRMAGSPGGRSELACATHRSGRRLPRRGCARFRRGGARWLSGCPLGSSFVRDPRGRPLLFAFASSCHYTINGRTRQRPTTSGYFVALVKSPDGTGCLSRSGRVIGVVKPDLLPVCNFYFLSGAWDNQAVVRTYRGFAPDMAIHYVRDLVFETGGFDLTKLGVPLRFRAGPPTPSPFELDAVLREQPVGRPATFSSDAGASGTSGARLEIDGLALGQMDAHAPSGPRLGDGGAPRDRDTDSDRGVRRPIPAPRRRLPPRPQ